MIAFVALRCVACTSEFHAHATPRMHNDVFPAAGAPLPALSPASSFPGLVPGARSTFLVGHVVKSS